MKTFSNIQEVIDVLPKSFRADKSAGVSAHIQLNYTGDAGGKWWLAIENQGLEVQEGEAENPTLTLTCEAENWLKIVNREANPMAMVMQKKLVFSGSMPMAMKFAAMFGLV
jgi:putative sterol carrier protein